jgi:sugar lactone lactonase YvrE
LANVSGRNLAVDSSGNIYIADSYDHRVRKVDAVTHIITTIAGTGTFGLSGDGGPATAAQIYYPSDVALDSAGDVFFTDYSNKRLCKVDTSGVISTFLTTTATPYSLAIDASDNVYFLSADRAYKYTHSTGLTAIIAGGSISGMAGDGGPGTAALLNGPMGISVDGAGNAYIADTYNARIRRVDATTGVITTVVGSGTPSYLGDGGQATLCGINQPNGVKVDSAGNLYIADKSNGVIRKVQTCDPAWTPSITPTVFIAPTLICTPTLTVTPVVSDTPTINDSPTPSTTATTSLTLTITSANTASQTPTITPSPTETRTQSAIVSAQDTPSFSPTLTPTLSAQDTPLISSTPTSTPASTGILPATPTATPLFTPLPKDTDDIRMPNLGRQGGSNLVVQVRGISDSEGPATLKAYVNGQEVDNVWSGNLSKNTTVIHWNPGNAVAPGTPFNMVLRRKDGTTFKRTFIYVE